MIREIAPLKIRPGHAAEFEAAFREAQAVIVSMPGYQERKRLLHHFYEPFPMVLHYEAVPGTPA